MAICQILIYFRFITGSYDRKCKLQDSIIGKNIASLKGHTNVVYCVQFNYHFDQIELLQVHLIIQLKYRFLQQDVIGHSQKVVCISFESNSQFVAMDNTPRLWDVGTGQQVIIYNGHLREFVYLKFNSKGDKLLTGSFDNPIRVIQIQNILFWMLDQEIVFIIQMNIQVNNQKCFLSQKGTIVHQFVISILIQFSTNTCKIWDLKLVIVHTFKNHQNEILRLFFNSTGRKQAAISSENTTIVYNVQIEGDIFITASNICSWKQK